MKYKIISAISCLLIAATFSCIAAPASITPTDTSSLNTGQSKTPVQDYARTLGTLNNLIDMLAPLDEDENMSAEEKGFVEAVAANDLNALKGLDTITLNLYDHYLSEINKINTELGMELMKLPDLQTIEVQDVEALKDILLLANNLDYTKQFEQILNEGIKSKRKYCSPLEALLWNAYDEDMESEFNLFYLYQDNIIEGFVSAVWQSSSTSGNYNSNRWGWKDAQIRLNSPLLINIWEKDNLKYDIGLFNHEPTPKFTYETKAGICRHAAILATKCLLDSGYDAKNVTSKWSWTGHYIWNDHTVSVINNNGLWIVADFSSTGIKDISGPFETYEEAARYITPPRQQILWMKVESNEEIYERIGICFLNE